MVVLRCTQRLAKRFRLQLEREPKPSTGVLGDWYANLLNVRSHRLVLCLSERTLLPVIMPARKAEFPEHFFGYLHALLKELGLPSAVTVPEAQASSETSFAPTRSRQILGSLNDFAFHASIYIERGESPLLASLRLAEMPSGAIEFNLPRELTESLLLAPGSA